MSAEAKNLVDIGWDERVYDDLVEISKEAVLVKIKESMGPMVVDGSTQAWIEAGAAAGIIATMDWLAERGIVERID